ncbi:WXG100 family type VII secretion target [Catenulispora sp. MAP5-51]|uniref:WXG100 family type VII secretion target n=1 Tax=Catenulispora sp. MAP5-51 TaxID=3156298 RepID=UPI003519AE39
MANITASYHDITDAAGKLSHFEQQTQDILKQAQALVQNLVASGFVTDRASKAFDDSYAKFTQGAQQLMQGMSGMGDYLKNAAQTLQQTDEQLAKGLGN